MSLVSDALRKARAYATARDIQRHGAAAGAYAPPPRRSRLGLGLVLGAVIALAAATTGAAFVLWWFGRGEPAAGAAAVPPGPANVATPAAEIEARAGAERPRPAPTRVDGENPSQPAAAVAAEPNPPAAASEAAPTATDQPPASAPPPADAPAGERVYVLRADLGYAKLQLDFLVYKPSGGFGRINGQDVIPGSVVDGFTVEEFGPDFVRLRDGRGLLVLRTR